MFKIDLSRFPRNLLVLFMLSTALLMQGCFWESDDPAPLPNQDASGLFTGSAEINGGSIVSDFKGIIYNNRFLIFSPSAHTLYDGRISDILSSSLTATADVYENGVKTQASISVTGTVITASQMTLELGGTGKGNGQVQLTYDDIYKRGATNGRINSSSPNPLWKGTIYSLMSNHITENFEKNDLSLNNYSFHSMDIPNTQCGYEGEILIPSTTINIYTVLQKRNVGSDYGVCNVTTAPNYDGFSSVVDGANQDDTLWYAVTNGTHSVFAVLTH